MSMDKWLYLIIFLLSTSCTDLDNNRDHLIVSGKVKSTSSRYVFLEILTPEGYEKIDSTKLKEDNSFLFQIPTGKAEIYQINFYGIQKNQIILDTHNISIVADGNQTQGYFSVSGSPEIAVLNKVNETSSKYKMEESLLRQSYSNLNSKKDTTGLKALREEFRKKEYNFHEYLKQSVRSLNGHLAAWLILTEYFDIEQNLDFYADQINLFKKTIPDSWHLKLLVKKYENIKRLAIGSVAPDFSLPDPDGNLIQLSSFRGKYVFLDFWASWCQPCRMENPELIKVYDKYRVDGFEIIGVSFDKRRDYWLQAIEQDGLEWKHVSDLKYFDSEMIGLYNIVHVPTTILLDQQGKIIAKNIHSKELAIILEEKL